MNELKMNLNILKSEHKGFKGWIAAYFRRRSPVSIQIVYRMDGDKIRHSCPAGQIYTLIGLKDEAIREILKKNVDSHNKKK